MIAVEGRCCVPEHAQTLLAAEIPPTPVCSDEVSLAASQSGADRDGHVVTPIDACGVLTGEHEHSGSVLDDNQAGVGWLDERAVVTMLGEPNSQRLQSWEQGEQAGCYVLSPATLQKAFHDLASAPARSAFHHTATLWREHALDLNDRLDGPPRRFTLTPGAVGARNDVDTRHRLSLAGIGSESQVRLGTHEGAWPDYVA